MTPLAVASWVWKRREWVAVFLIIVALTVASYALWAHFHPPKPVTFESQQEASTPAGVQKAADNAQVPISAGQAFDISKYIHDSADKPPAATVATTAAKMNDTVEQNRQKAGADFSIVTDPNNPDKPPPDAKTLKPDQQIVLNQYNVQAYPKELTTVGGGPNGFIIGISREIKVPKIPLILPKGEVGYLGVTGVHFNRPAANAVFATVTVPTEFFGK